FPREAASSERNASFSVRVRQAGGDAGRHAAARRPSNLPSPEKLTDSTLPLIWPAPYPGHPMHSDLVLSPDACTAPGAGAIDSVSEEYARLMRKLQANSLLARQCTRTDKALHAAHHVATLLAALAFAAMMGLVIIASLS